MQKQILSELKELRNLLSKVVGTSDLPTEAQFSTAALDKAASEFKKMQIARGEWIPENEIYKFIKNAGWRAGKFIRTEFYFSNYFKQGHSYYYNKNDLVKLSKECLVLVLLVVRSCPLFGCQLVLSAFWLSAVRVFNAYKYGL